MKLVLSILLVALGASMPVLLGVSFASSLIGVDPIVFIAGWFK